MDKFLNGLKKLDNYTTTENGAVSFKSTLNKVLDAFASLGSMRFSTEDEIISTFKAAFMEDRERAMRLLFYIRDIRGGQGARKVFRTIVTWLAINYPKYIINNLDNFLHFGRGDDLLCLFDTPCEEAMLKYVEKVLMEDMEHVSKGEACSLLAKWMPSCNTSSADTRNLAKRFAKAFDISLAQYRKMLSKLRKSINIVETKMSANKWDDISFSALPAKAQLLYRKAFINHCYDNYIDWLKDIADGKASVNAASLFPVDIVEKALALKSYNYMKEKDYLPDKYLYSAMWEALPNYFGDTEESAICMCDTSGSMYGYPILVSLALGIYCADKCKGPFKNHFITFDYEPRLQELVGDDIVEKVASIASINPANTNFEAALQLILDTAINNNLKQEDLPAKLYVISDMQFDQATGENVSSYWSRTHKDSYRPFMQIMKQRFADAGYIMPAIVYWNVRPSDCGMFHETVDGEDCCMVSGYSPSLFKSIIDGTEFVQEEDTNGEIKIKQKLDPIKVMDAAIMSERYDRVWF